MKNIKMTATQLTVTLGRSGPFSRPAGGYAAATAIVITRQYKKNLLPKNSSKARRLHMPPFPLARPIALASSTSLELICFGRTFFRLTCFRHTTGHCCQTGGGTHTQEPQPGRVVFGLMTDDTTQKMQPVGIEPQSDPYFADKKK